MSFSDEERNFNIELSDKTGGAGCSCTFKPIILPLTVPRAIKIMAFFLYLASHNIMDNS